MDRDERERKLAMASGVAEAAEATASTLRTNVAVYFEDEFFGAALRDELRGMTDRLRQIGTDLAVLSAAREDVDAAYLRGELHRLANRGQEPADADADRAQLEAIEGHKAA